MLHLVFCPNCGENVKIHCDNVPNPFQQIHADQITRILNAPPAKPASSSLSPATISHLKLLFLLDMIGDDLPDLDNLPELPTHTANFIDRAGEAEIKHILFQAVGRWDTLKELIPPN
ncbi:hypothetical protein KS4_35380 [Poriferisphaera corsica]|uniref:Uncharacterized protein n=1 Tax=Poriferisphaera corsica TaxID=2528020 RepID=A0A517YZ05_9BACT|nr:hypothetical protein [Poriferisphaera corsica]QDU35455.1 hypothetical protein KS4_35380 [Poriferisphaera corsica]